MNRYLVTLGNGYWPALNSVWAVLREGIFEPEEIYVMGEEREDGELDSFLSDLKTLLDSYDSDGGVETILYPDADFSSISEEIDEILEGEDEIALDITGGSKELLTALLISRKENFDHVFCLSLEDGHENNRPYPSIPHSKTEILDFKTIYGKERQSREEEGQSIEVERESREEEKGATEEERDSTEEEKRNGKKPAEGKRRDRSWKR